MESDVLWETFLLSGRISDYLNYRQTLREELAQEIQPMEEQDAAEDRRRGDPREGDGGE